MSSTALVLMTKNASSTATITFGLPVADRFLALWQEVTGETYNPWAETVMLIDALGWMGPRTDRERLELERVLRTRLAELGA